MLRNRSCKEMKVCRWRCCKTHVFRVVTHCRFESAFNNLYTRTSKWKQSLLLAMDIGKYILLIIYFLGEENEDFYASVMIKKCKSVPLQAWSGPEGSRKLRFPDFMTMAQGGGKVVSLTHRPHLPPRKSSWYSFLLEAVSTPGP